MKRLATIFFAVSVLCLCSMAIVAQVCTSPPIGLISSWSADGDALDARSRYNGTIQNGVTYTAGKVGNAFNLAGNNGDRVLLGNTPDLRRQNFTIEAWVKRSSSTVVTNSANPGSPGGIFFAFGQNGYAFLIQQGTGKIGLSQVGQSQILTPNFTITDTNWHHIAVTISGPPLTGGTQTIFYLDGVADTPTGYAPQLSFTTNAAIGSRGDGQTDNVFFGAIDELSIYDRALSPAQIAAIFAADTAGKCKPIATNAPDNQVLWLAGDGDANDSTGNIGSAALQNGAEYQVGKVGQGFKFDGINDQITVPHNANQNGGTNLTIEAWVKVLNSNIAPTILQKRSSGNVGGYTLEFIGNQSLQFCVQISGTFRCLSGVNIIGNAVWSHVAATYDGAAMRVYINGTQILSQAQTGAIDPVSDPIVIGRNVVLPGNVLNGSLDEIGVYNRALSAAEIQSIFNADLAGKYKAQATVPSGIAAWYPADGNTNDLQAANNATLQGGATYADGKVGQAFSFNGTNAYVTAPSTPANDTTGASGATMEAWIYLNQLPSAAGRNFYIMSKSGTGATDDLAIFVGTDNGLKTFWGSSVSGGGNPLQSGQWYHVAVVYTPGDQVLRYYFNGVFSNTQFAGSPRTTSGEPLTIGRDTPTVSNTLFNGLIDEPAIYNRSLSEAEIRDQYYAGSRGRYKGAANPTVGNVTVNGDVTTTFTGVTAAGAVHHTPLNLSSLPPLPVGATSVGLTYDISSTVAAGSPTYFCYRLPGLSSTEFANLGILHLESGVWVDRASARNTATRTICGSSLTLSPFALAQVLAPTSSNSSISGRVMTSQGRGIRNAVMSLSDSQGIVRTTRTSSLGYYAFEEVPSGQTYVLSASSKQYTFTPSTRLISLVDSITDADFNEDGPQELREVEPKLGVKYK